MIYKSERSTNLVQIELNVKPKGYLRRTIEMGLGKHHLLTLHHLQGLTLAKNQESSDFESVSTSILLSLQRALRFDAAWVLKFDPSSLHISNIYLHQFSQKAFSRYLDFFYTKAPLPTIYQIKNEGFVSKRGSDLIEDAIWIETPFYKEIVQPLGLQFFLTGACINEKNKYTGMVVLWRSSSRHDFSSRDCFFLEKASVHCATLLEQIETRKNGPDRPEIIRLIERRSSPGVILLGRGNDILYINREAKNILTMMRSGKAHLSGTDEERFLAKLQQLKEKALENASFPQLREHSSPCEVFTFRGTTFSCRGIPLEQDEGDSHKDSVMILIEMVKENGHPSSAATKGNSDFTAREGAVVGLIGRGLTNKEIASELGIGIHTVKDHIKNIMGKLRTHTRSGIVAKTLVK